LSIENEAQETIAIESRCNIDCISQKLQGKLRYNFGITMIQNEIHELENEARYKEEVQKHNEYMNSVLGFIAFTLALSCLSFTHPQRPAFLCLGIILPI
jgi:hypothetical protein